MNKPSKPGSFTQQTAANRKPSYPKPAPPETDPHADEIPVLPPTKMVVSRHLEGITDLVVAAPIRQGFVDAFEHVTFETRLKLTARALFDSRQATREYEMVKSFADPVERIRSIRSFRIAVVEIPTQNKIEKRLVLSVTFDQPWEPYIRLVWRPLGLLIDLMFCNTDGYVTAGDHTFEEFVRWLRKHQVDTSYFYATSNLSATDFQYLVQIEKAHREEKPTEELDRVAVGTIADDPEIVAQRVRTDPATAARSHQIALETLGGFYRLTSFYPPDRAEREGRLLHRATRSFLDGWKTCHIHRKVRDHYREWLAWYENEDHSEFPPTSVTIAGYDRDNVQGGILTGYDKNHPDDPITHGCLLLLQVTKPEGGRKFLASLRNQISTDASNDRRYLNLALTHRGLRSLGVPSAELRKFPQEFQEGADQRSGPVGDVMRNHPRRWRLPARNWPPNRRFKREKRVNMSEIDLVLQLRSTEQGFEGHDLFANGGIDPGHPLAKRVKELAKKAEKNGVRLLSVQPMRSWPAKESANASGYVTREHFGYLDGFSNPMAGDSGTINDRVRLGDMLLGYQNSRSDEPADPNPFLDDGTFLVIRKVAQHVGAFRQWVAAACKDDDPKADKLYTAMMGRSREGRTPIDEETDNDFSYDGDARGEKCPFQAHVRRANPRRDEIGRPVSRIMRRGMSYGPRLGDDAQQDDGKERGLLFMSYQASIAEQYETIQRWLNGGNSTGVSSAQSDPITGVARPDDERVFRWRDGDKVYRHRVDNIDRKAGRLGNPFVTLEWMLYLFVPSIATIGRIARDPVQPAESELGIGRADLLELGKGLTELLQNAEKQLEAKKKLAPLMEVPYGASELRLFRAMIVSLARLAWAWLKEKIFGPPARHLDHLDRPAVAWKSIFEDLGAKDAMERAYGPAVWAWIRKAYGGILRVPYGNLLYKRELEDGRKPIEKVVLVASKKLVEQVYNDPDGCYSVDGQGERMKQSFGRIFIGMDFGDEYLRESEATNDILMSYSEKDAFEVAHGIADEILDSAFAEADRIRRDLKGGADDRKLLLDLSNQFITPALAGICTHWFGIPDPEGEFIEAGTWRRVPFDARSKPRCPGDYMAPSRYMFYPDPNPAVQKYGQQLGQRLGARVKAMYEAMHSEDRRPTRTVVENGKAEPAPIAERMYEAIIEKGPDDEPIERKLDLLTRNVIGVMMGMLPPTDGNLRGGLHAWLRDETLWRVQRALASANRFTAYERAQAALEEPLKRVMQRYPAPDMVWRTATRTHRLGRLKIKKGEKLFVGIVSATLEDHGNGGHDVYPIFGGNRCPKGGDRSTPPAGGYPANGQGHPTHACPGYNIAMGTMMGILTALLEKGEIQPLTAPLMIKLTDPTYKPPKRPQPIG